MAGMNRLHSVAYGGAGGAFAFFDSQMQDGLPNEHVVWDDDRINWTGKSQSLIAVQVGFPLGGDDSDNDDGIGGRDVFNACLDSQTISGFLLEITTNGNYACKKKIPREKIRRCNG